MTLHFHGVGRHKKSWTCEVHNLVDSTLIKQLRKHRALMSRDIDLVWSEDGLGGDIYVGLLRHVGTYSVDGGLHAAT